MPKSAATKISPRMVKPGDRIQIPGSTRTEVVRSVTVHLNLANGEVVPYADEAEAALVSEEPLVPTEEEVAAIETRAKDWEEAEPIREQFEQVKARISEFRKNRK